MELKNVGVIGAGVMGTGLAQNLAQTRHRVILVDVSEKILNQAKQQIRNSVRFGGLFQKGQRGADPDEILSRIELTTDYQALGGADFVIENVTEKWEIKREIYPELDRICPERCIFAANTSAISITKLASLTQRAPQVLGMHFMNPVPMKKMVEVIRGYHTSGHAIEMAQALLAQMGKEGIVVNDSPGFVSNRILMLTINEAIFVVQDQVAPAEEVDRIFKTCFEHKMGPLETADLIGLDTILLSLEVLYESFNDSKYRPCPLLKKLVDAGLLGRKSGQGFYSY